MTKKHIEEVIDGSSILDCTSLGTLKWVVEQEIKKHGELATLEFDAGYNNIDCRITYLREETDLEYERRSKQEAASKIKRKVEKEKQEEKERKEYLRLKKKYEK